MVRTRQTKPLSREEKLKRKREAEKRRYERLKRDPAGREQLRQKEVTQYLKKKEKKVIRPVNELCERDQRQKRKQWREYSQRYRNKQKEERNKNEILQVQLQEDTPPNSEVEDHMNVLPRNTIRRSGSKRYARNRKRRSRENKQKDDLIKKLKLKLQKYKQKYYRSKKTVSKEKNPPTPTTRVKQILASNEKNTTVAKKLLFGEVISDQLKLNYGSLKSQKEKQIFKNVIAGEVVKKYRVTNNVKTLCRGGTVPATANIKECISKSPKRASHTNWKKRNAIWKFLESDLNSKLCPGKKNYYSKNKTIKQKRYLSDTLQNLHKKFLVAHPDKKISYSFWCKNRPFWIVHRKVTARDTCGCTPCSNMTLLVEALHRMGILEKNNVEEIIKILCCENKTEKCLLRECTLCNGKRVCYKPYDDSRIGHFFKWVVKKDTFLDKKTHQKKYVMKTTKEKFVKSTADIIFEFEGSISKFLKHKGRVLHQYTQITSKKANLKENEVILHMDFSENYCLKYAEETQAFHFGASRQQVSLHTVVIYFKSEGTVQTKSFCTLSESLEHNIAAIWAHLKPILVYISENLGADTLIFVSDSPATQYRNRNMFYFLAVKLHRLYPQIKAFSWNYLEAGHGKGAPDGIGGVTKRTADRLVSEGKDVDCLDTLLKNLKENISNVTYFVVTKEEFEIIDSMIEKKDIKPFIGTMQVHQVIMNKYSQGILNFLSLSSFDAGDSNYFMGKLDYSNAKEQNASETLFDSDDELPLIHFLPQKSTKKIRYEDVYSDDEAGPSSVFNEFELTPKNIKTGVYLLIELKTERHCYRYVGVTQSDLSDDEVTVMFLKLCTFQNCQAFNANENDVSFVMYDQIISILPPPLIFVVGKKVFYKFENEIEVFEKAF